MRTVATVSAARSRRSLEESRDLILDGARRVLETTTVADVTVGDVMAETPLGRSSFYVHFAELHDVWQALLEGNVSLFVEPVKPYLEVPSRETLGVAIRGLVDVWYPNRRWWGELVGSAMAGGSRLSRQWRRTELDLWGPTIGALVPADAPVVRAGAAREAAGRQIVLLLMATLAEVAHDDHIDQVVLKDSLVALATAAFYGA